MNLQQLKIVRETVRQDFNLTAVAEALYTSQPGVSRHIRDLEDELGVELFLRRGKRLLGLSEPGKELLVLVERMLIDANNIKRLADQYSQVDVGQLTIVTTHTQARYSLPPIVNQFRALYPKVHLHLHQGSPSEINQMLLDGHADIGIATEVLGNEHDLIALPFYSWRHCVVVNRDHPLAALEKPMLKDVASYPIITYHEGFTGRVKVDQAFEKAGLNPEIAISALDADVIKTYVDLGLGVGVIASMAFNKDTDRSLKVLELSEEFPVNTTCIAVRKGNYLRSYANKFIELCNPELGERKLKEYLQNPD